MSPALSKAALLRQTTSVGLLPSPAQSARTQTGGCFIKGTRVHTKEGLKPIEEISVGHYVLSSSEDGSGRPEYKRVIRVFVHEQKTIVRIGVFKNREGTLEAITATGNHPFWVEGVGWTRADELKVGSILRMADGKSVKVVRQQPVYRTGRDGIGWVANMKNIVESEGSVFDYANYALVERRDEDRYLSDEVLESDDPFLRVRVYNLEVEDYRTYYVGAAGYWVHGE